MRNSVKRVNVLKTVTKVTTNGPLQTFENVTMFKLGSQYCIGSLSNDSYQIFNIGSKKHIRKMWKKKYS